MCQAFSGTDSSNPSYKSLSQLLLSPPITDIKTEAWGGSVKCPADGTSKTQTEPAGLRNYNFDLYTPRLPGVFISLQSRLEHLGCSFQKCVVCSPTDMPSLVIIAALLHNSPKVGITRTPVNRRTDGGIFTHRRLQSSENKGLLFTATWLSLTNVMLTERWLTQKNTYCMFPLRVQNRQNSLGA